MKKLLNILATLMLAVGFGFLVWPFASRFIYGITSTNAVDDFKKRYEITDDTKAFEESSIIASGNDVDNTSSEKEKDSNVPEKGTDKSDGSGNLEGYHTGNYLSLYNDMKAYNERIYADNQAELKDAFSYTVNDFDFKAEGLVDDMIGYITIPAMDIVLPLYIGASRDNLAMGATVLSKTSMPIGGANTNCVIAGHRGYRGQEMFVNIESLEMGDDVYINNLWGRLHYKVAGITEINPDDIDKIKIIPGEEMVTLVTCHPYHHNYLRYVVYCTRSYENDDITLPGSGETKPQKEESAALKNISKDARGENFESSTESIASYYMLNIIGLILVALIIIYLVIRNIIYRIRKSKK